MTLKQRKKNKMEYWQINLTYVLGLLFILGALIPMFRNETTTWLMFLIIGVLWTILGNLQEINKKL